MKPYIKVDKKKLEALGATERDKAVAAIRELEAAVQANPLLRYNNPRFGPVHAKQIAFHELVAAGYAEVAYMGGNQSGKTTSATVDDIIQAIDAEMVPEHLKKYKKHTPPFRCRIGAQGREEIEDFVFEKLREWCPMDQLVGGTWKTAYDKQHHVLHFKNGSYFQFKTYQQDGQQWGGSTLDRVHCDEEPGVVHLKESRIRVMRREGQVLFSMTPVEGLSHMYEVFEDAIEVAEHSDDGMAITTTDGGITRALVYSDMDDNPWLTEASKAQALEGLSEEERRARKQGRFVAMSGLIYGRFDRDVHVIEPMDRLPDNVNVIVSIDPGFRFAAAIQWHYIDTKDNMVMFEELHLHEHTIKQQCEQIHLVNAAYGVEPMYYVIDTAAANRNNITGRSEQSEYADHGIVTIAAQKKVTAGINRCRERLDRRAFHVTSNCINFLKEIRQYRWKKPPKTESEGKAEPVKANDHQMDAWRYAVMSRPYGPDEEVPDNETHLEKMVREEIEELTRAPVPMA
jgi:phage terminase large subunit-like protein